MSTDPNFYCSDIPSFLELDGVKTPGKFTIFENYSLVVIQWKSDDYAPFSTSTYNFNQAFIYQYLHYVQSIQILTQDKEGNRKVQISVPQLPTYSRFVFSEENHLHLLKALDSLHQNGYIMPHSTYPGVYKITIKRSVNVRYPPDSLNLNQVQCFWAQKISRSKLPSPPLIDTLKCLTYDEFLSHQNSNGTISNYQEIIQQVSIKGLDDKSRPYVWPYLYNFFKPEMTSDDKRLYLEKKLQEYKILKDQLETYDEELQQKFDIHYNDCIKDALRTDRSLAMFSSDDSPGIKMLTRMLQIYSIYNMDTRFVQGMGDILSQFMRTFIKDVKEETVIMFDDKELTKIEGESFIFWNFVKMMSKTQQECLFGQLKLCQAFIAERAFAIASNANSLLGEWFTVNELNSLLFLYSPFLLIFKRFLRPDSIPLIWDVFFAAEDSNALLRFLTAAVLFFLFPEITAQKNAQLGDVTIIVQETMRNMEANDILVLTQQLLQKAKNDTAQNQWLFMKLPSNHTSVDFYPSCLKLYSSY